MRVALVTEGTYPHHRGGVSVWCDQIVRGLSEHRYEVVAIVGSGTERAVWELPPNVTGVTAVPLWAPTPPVDDPAPGEHLAPLLARFFDVLGSAGTAATAAAVLHDLFLAAQDGLLRPALSSPTAIELLLAHMRAEAGPSPRRRRSGGAGDPATRGPVVADAAEALVLIEHFLRPLAAPPPEADLCHAVSNGLASLPALAARWRHGTPFLLTEHGLYLRERLLAHRPGTLSPHVRSVLLRFVKRLVEATYLEADLVSPVSHYCQLWELRSGADRSKIHPVHNGIDPDRFPYDPGEPDAPTVVFVGRIDPLKDVETLLRAFALIRAELPGARLRMYGPRELEAYGAHLDGVVDELGLAGSATFEGPVDSPAEAYRSGQVVLLTSISEGFPFAVLEAMACGRPVVATDVGGVAEAVAHTGVLVPPRDPAAVAAATLGLLADPARRRELGRQARDRVLDHFTLETCIGNYRGLYRDVTHPNHLADLLRWFDSIQVGTGGPGGAAGPEGPAGPAAPVGDRRPPRVVPAL